MDIVFNFPDLISFKVQMDQPPRQGEFVRADNIPHNNFPSTNQWDLYHNKGYNKGEWIVTKVTYSIAPKGHYANVMLQRAPAPSFVHN